MKAPEVSMLELELELAFEAAEQRARVRTTVGTFTARVVQSGPFVAIVVPWNDAVGAEEFATALPGAAVVDVLPRAAVRFGQQSPEGSTSAEGFAGCGICGSPLHRALAHAGPAFTEVAGS